MITYHVWSWIKCKWITVTTTRAIWGATPRAVGMWACKGAILTVGALPAGSGAFVPPVSFPAPVIIPAIPYAGGYQPDFPAPWVYSQPSYNQPAFSPASAGFSPSLGNENGRNIQNNVFERNRMEGIQEQMGTSFIPSNETRTEYTSNTEFNGFNQSDTINTSVYNENISNATEPKILIIFFLAAIFMMICQKLCRQKSIQRHNSGSVKFQIIAAENHR